MPTRQAQGDAGTDHAADRLLAAIDKVGSPVCVGIDPVLERLPAPLRPAGGGWEQAADALESFSIGVLDAIAGDVACVKVQAACFERYRHLGLAALYRVVGEARQRGFVVILDGKRGDISVSAEHYAAAAFDPPAGQPRPDWITVNSYLGQDAIAPFVRPGAGVFALVRTSNPGGDAVQARPLAGGQTVAESVAAMIADLGRSSVGQCGYSSVGAVVAATRPGEAAGLRALMPQQIFLVPGYGAQGAEAADVVPCFRDGNRGAIVSAGRSVIYAFDPGSGDWTKAVGDAARRFAGEIAGAVASCVP